MPDKIIHVDHIGSVTFRKNKRSKNVSITIRPMKGVIVNLPYFLSYKYAIGIVENRRDWIIKHLPKIEEIEKKVTVFTEKTSFKTKYHTLTIQKYEGDLVKTKITSDSLIISCPKNIDIKTPEIQKIIKEMVIAVLRIEAKSFLPNRTQYIAEKLNFKFKRIFIKNNSTLWGSCSGSNNISLNLHLMRLPDHLIDYVIIHELCHTVEKNHGKQFWSLMDSILGNAKMLSKELKKYSIQIY